MPISPGRTPLWEGWIIKNEAGDWELETEAAMMIEHWSENGLTDAQIARNIGCGITTFNTWKKQFGCLRDALKAGKAWKDDEVVSALLKNALGFSYDEVSVTTRPDGYKETKVTTKYVQGQTLAQMYWLNNRRPEDWRAKRHDQFQSDDAPDSNDDGFMEAMNLASEEVWSDEDAIDIPI